MDHNCTGEDCIFCPRTDEEIKNISEKIKEREEERKKEIEKFNIEIEEKAVADAKELFIKYCFSAKNVEVLYFPKSITPHLRVGGHSTSYNAGLNIITKINVHSHNTGINLIKFNGFVNIVSGDMFYAHFNKSKIEYKKDIYLWKDKPYKKQYIIEIDFKAEETAFQIDKINDYKQTIATYKTL